MRNQPGHRRKSAILNRGSRKVAFKIKLVFLYIQTLGTGQLDIKSWKETHNPLCGEIKRCAPIVISSILRDSDLIWRKKFFAR